MSAIEWREQDDNPMKLIGYLRGYPKQVVAMIELSEDRSDRGCMTSAFQEDCSEIMFGNWLVSWLRIQAEIQFLEFMERAVPLFQEKMGEVVLMARGDGADAERMGGNG